MSTADLPATEKRSAFAARLGVRRGYVTQLAKEGRIVCDEKGDVLVPESLQRIEDTRDPVKDPVAQRWAEHRAHSAAGAQSGGHDADTSFEHRGSGQAGVAYQNARAVKERYNALTAKAEYEQRIGKLCATEDVARAGADIGALIRTQHESLADRLAPEIAAITDTEQAYARIKEALDDVLADISRQLKRVAEEASEQHNADAA